MSWLDKVYKQEQDQRTYENDYEARRTYESSDFFLSLARGEHEGVGSEFKFGRSANITSTESVIWDGGSNYTFLEIAETMDIVSTSVEDAVGGTGAITMVIFGLDADYLEISEVITLTGLTPVTTQNSYIRVFRMLVLTSGTNDPILDANKGIISATGTDTSTLQARILVNNGQTLMMVYTVPAGKTGFITGISFSAGQGKQCFFKGKFRNGPTSNYAFSVKFTIDLYQTPFFGNLTIPLRVPEMTDIVITGQTGLGGTIDASASFGIILVDN